jgi:hypothetical protein
MDRRDLPRDVEVDELATLLQAAAMGTWVGCAAADIILCGAAFSYRR